MKQTCLSVPQHFRRWSVVLVFVVASTTLLPQPTQASHTEGNHCIHPNGTDLNEFYGVAEQIVTPFCTQVDSGEHWITTGGPAWIMNTSFEVVPQGFVPVGETPLDDFLAKFVAVKYVVDPGTLQERIYTFPKNDRLWMSTIAGFPAVHPVTLGTLRPLSVAEHVVHVYWVFSAMHCDGFADVIEENCLGPGEIAYSFLIEFEVTPGAQESH